MNRKRFGGMAFSTLWAAGAASSALAADAPVDVKIGVADIAIFNNFPLLLADNLGYFKDEGLNVSVVSFKTGPMTVQAVISGEVAFGFNGIDQVVNLRAAGKDVKVVGTSVVSLGNQLIATPDITSVQGLRGKSVGISSFGSGTDIILEYLLHKNGVANDSLTVVPVGLSQTFVAAFASHRIDAGVASAPWTTYLIKRGLGHVLVDLESPAGTKAVYGGPYAYTSLWATKPYIDQNGPTVEKLVRAVARANRYLQQTPFAQVKTHVPAAMLGDEPATALEGLEGLLRGVAPTPVVSIAEAQRALDADAAVVKAVADAVASGQLKAADVIDMRAARKVAKDLGLPASPE